MYSLLLGIVNLKNYFLKILSSSDLSFYVVDGFFCCAKPFLFDVVPFFLLFSFVSLA